MRAVLVLAVLCGLALTARGFDSMGLDGGKQPSDEEVKDMQKRQRAAKRTGNFDDYDDEHGPVDSGEGMASIKPGDEEWESKVPPRHMRCDCCAASAFWIHRSLKLAHKEQFLKRLREDEVIDTIDDICLPKTFSRTYGIKTLNGRHVLSGGGLKGFYAPGGASGILGPGQWLNHACREIQGEFYEDGLYDLFWKYHVKEGLEKSDVPFFRDICIKQMKKCTEKEALASYDGYDEKEQKEWTAKDKKK
jgi:hypothetical protein